LAILPAGYEGSGGSWSELLRTSDDCPNMLVLYRM
jgi:hypothetical protein